MIPFLHRTFLHEFHIPHHVKPLRIYSTHLHARHGVDHQHRAVEHPQASLHFQRKVHVPRGVDQAHLRVGQSAPQREL